MSDLRHERILVFNLQNCIRNSKNRTINYITEKNKHTDFQNQLLLPTWATGGLRIDLSVVIVVPQRDLCAPEENPKDH